MRRSLLLSLLLLCLCPPATAARRALLIGVTGYPANAGLVGAAKDPGRLKAFLETQHEFRGPDAQITVLNTRESTRKAAILEAFRKLAADTRADDIVFISFSGHGSTQPNPAEVDGRDELLVASEGLPGAGSPPNAPNGAILDDAIKDLLGEILKQKPANLTFVVDACNSGGVSRGTWTPRRYPGTPEIEVPENVLKREEQWVDGATRQGVLDCFYAAQSGDTAKDIGSGGAFTTLLIKKGLPGIACGELMREIQRDMGHLQNPYGEFAQEERPFLGKKAPGFPAYRIDQVSPDGKTARLLAGRAQGMTEGSILGVYAPDEALRASEAVKPATDDRLLARVRITKAGDFTSDLEIVERVKLAASAPLPNAGQVLVLARNYDLRVPVLVEGAPADAPVMKELQSSPILRLVNSRSEKHQLWLQVEAPMGRRVWKIQDPITGKLLPATRWVNEEPVPDVAKFTDDQVFGLRDALERYAQAINVRDLQNEEWKQVDPKTSPVRVEVVELEGGEEKVVAPGADGVVRLKLGRQVRLRLYDVPQEELGATNRELYNYYFSVLNVAPDGEVAFLAPSGTAESRLLPRKAGEKPLLVGDSEDPRLRLEAISLSRDTEYFQIVLSREKLDLKPLANPPVLLEGTRRGDPLPSDPINQLLQRALGGTRGPAKPVSALHWFTIPIKYQVIE